ncbi:MAG TPA: alpha/beta hydrolase [Verrucomicrobiales bacterium]|nr:alpha/beta hydrolase [Verrucomicrobiales bacterium]HIL68250.1 alpha/beta hydrolase [Verrucomicrobiota bacterium]
MQRLLNLLVTLPTLIACFTLLCRGGESIGIIDLWPDGAPGETEEFGKEKDVTKPTDRLISDRSIIKLANVTRPTITIYAPPKDKNTGTAVVVCPGGGYHILALDLEGTEVCEWLNSIGITGILLKYRVPKRKGLEKHTAPLQDAQRAIGIVRHNAAKWNINPQRIGILGFSAGGHLSAAVSLNHKVRTYPLVDDADQISCRPDFTFLLYPGYLTVKDEGDAIAPDLKITENCPPTFLMMAQDDPVRVENVLYYALALRKNKVPFSLHIYPDGGHGYGLRPSKHLVTTWPDRAAAWMRSLELIPTE